MLHIIRDNAFRVIGTPVNASVKQRLANLTRIKAYARVNREVSFPLDVSYLISQPDRSLDAVQRVFSKLSNPDELLRYALFWFYTVTPEQQKAAECLAQKDIHSAEKMYAEGSDFSSVISYATLMFIQEKGDKAIRRLNRLVEDPGLTHDLETFLTALHGQPLQITPDRVLEVMIETLLESYAPHNLSKIYESIHRTEKIPFYKEARDLINSKNIQKLIKNTESEIQAQQSLLDSDHSAAFQHAPDFLKKCSLNIRYLEKSMAEPSTEFMDVCDKIANTVANCAVARLNDLEEPDLDVAKEALRLIKQARKIACSDLVISKCDEHITVLNGILSFDDFDF